ncbi:hypothetical protein OG866_43075 [Streptomyces sp. NBC_00663]|uniref:hypothetical protein n=1 Tax=Streptomyces sp. NBC_00663 TaxID=2975801 RepID=UPI002E2FEA45|nr:hypothetical protein [Streptomyces sp. NBC_00663]
MELAGGGLVPLAQFVLVLPRGLRHLVPCGVGVDADRLQEVPLHRHQWVPPSHLPGDPRPDVHPLDDDLARPGREMPLSASRRRRVILHVDESWTLKSPNEPVTATRPTTMTA